MLLEDASFREVCRKSLFAGSSDQDAALNSFKIANNMTLLGFQSSVCMTARCLIIMLLTNLALLGCDGRQLSQGLQQIKFDGSTMGTSYQVQVVVPKSVEQKSLEKRVEDELNRLNRIFSTYDTASELSLFNQRASTDTIEISKELAKVIFTAQLIGEASGGALDVTVGPLVELWGFGGAAAVPFSTIEAQLPIIMQLVGNELFSVDVIGASITKIHAGLKLDLSAVAKGYAVDAVYELLRAQGIDNLLVEIGGEVKAAGEKLSGESWRAGLEMPLVGKRAVGWVIALNELAVASSGDYRHYFEHNNVRYSHVLDPKTGRPIRYRNVSVSVVHPDAMAADAWATAFTVLGHTEGLRIAAEQNIAVQFAVGEQVYRSAAFDLLPVEKFRW